MSLLSLKGVKASMVTAAITLLPAVGNAAGGNLEANDPVGITFWLISIAMVAATAFFFIETTRVENKWKPS